MRPDKSDKPDMPVSPASTTLSGGRLGWGESRVVVLVPLGPTFRTDPSVVNPSALAATDGTSWIGRLFAHIYKRQTGPQKLRVDAAAARPVRGYPREHGELEAGDTFIWCGHLLRVEPGGVALGMPIRELILHVSEAANG